MELMKEPGQQKLETREENVYINRIVNTRRFGRKLRYALPRIISASNRVTKINNKAPYPDEEESMNGKADGDMVITNKMSIKGHGDWNFDAHMVKASNFSTRKEFEEMVLQGTHCSSGDIEPKIFSRISLVDAFKNVEVDILINTQYLIDTSSEDQKDTFEIKTWQYGRENVEKMIMHSFLVSLFGVPSKNDNKIDDCYPKVISIDDFHCYSPDGNSSYGTARYGDYYIFLEFETS